MVEENTYLVIDGETNRVLAQNVPLYEALRLVELLCKYAPEVRDYCVAHCGFTGLSL